MRFFDKQVKKQIVKPNLYTGDNPFFDSLLMRVESESDGIGKILTLQEFIEEMEKENNGSSEHIS